MRWTGLLRRLRSLRGKRLAAAVVVTTAAGAAIVIGATAGIGRSGVPNGRLARAPSLAAVVAQVRQSFGDRQIVSASLEGPVLAVTLHLPGGRRTPGYGVKGTFEAQILGAAVADWMRAHGRQPIATVRYRDRGRVIPGTLANGDSVETDPSVSPLAADACETAAKAAGTDLLALVSARTLPYLNGTCVFTFEAADLKAGSGAAMAALSRVIDKIGPPNERPWLFELHDTSGVPKTGASWMPGSGTTWATPGLAYPLAHG